MQVQDVRGQVFDATCAPQRIVSLVPSWMEALFTFGAGERVVGVTGYCIHPRTLSPLSVGSTHRIPVLVPRGRRRIARGRRRDF